MDILRFWPYALACFLGFALWDLIRVKGTGNSMSASLPWVSVKERAPDQPGLYLVHSPSSDQEQPMICTAWFEPEGTGNMPGWQLMPEPFVGGITHWMAIVPPGLTR